MNNYMNNRAVQNSSFDEETNFLQKAAPIAPKEESKSPKKAQGAFRTISEVADELDVPQHVLRFWETKFTQIKPLKRGGGRRYYRPEDVSLLKHIHNLLYTEGYTIKGVQKLLKGQGKNQIAAQMDAAEERANEPVLANKIVAQNSNVANAVNSDNVYDLSDNQRGALEDMLSELKALRALFPENA